MSEVLLEASNVAIHFGGVIALSNFNLIIRQGELSGLIGPNGAGKTTAFNAITGVYVPHDGYVKVRGKLTHRKRPFQITRLGVARTFQNIRLFKKLSVLDNVRVAIVAATQPLFPDDMVSRCRNGNRALRCLGYTLDAINNYRDWWRAFLKTNRFLEEERLIERKARELLEVMGLAHRSDELAQNLPYGEQRRLEIARALGTNPRVLLLDEPAAGMNTREKSNLMVLIRQLREQFALGILLIEHDMKLVMGICEHLTVLHHGKTIATGSPAEVRMDPKVIEAYLGEISPHA